MHLKQEDSQCAPPGLQTGISRRHNVHDRPLQATETFEGIFQQPNSANHGHRSLVLARGKGSSDAFQYPFSRYRPYPVSSLGRRRRIAPDFTSFYVRATTAPRAEIE